MSSRRETDLDSIEVGTPSKGGAVKLYLNTRADTLESITPQLNELFNIRNRMLDMHKIGEQQ